MIEYFGVLFGLQESGYSLATLVIMVLVSLATYWIINASPVSGWFTSSEDVVPPFLALPAILFALFVTALATDVWQKHFQAKEALLKETAAVRSLILLSSELKSNGQVLRQATETYINGVINREWAAMTQGDHMNKESALPELEALDTTIAKIGNGNPGSTEYTALRLNNALETLRLSRQQRISLAHDAISITKWAATMSLAVLTLVSVAVVHLRRPRAMKMAMLLTVLCVLATIHVLSKNRSPYLGIAAISNNLLVDSLKILDQEKRILQLSQ